MYYTVYRITNKINGKIYTGKHQTKDLNDNYMGSGKLIKRAIEKHGIENFTKEILHVFDSEEEMNLKEAELVTIGDHSYNLADGGQGGFGYINRNPEKFLTEKRLNSLTKGSIYNQPVEIQKKWIFSVKVRNQDETYLANQKEGLRKYYETHDGTFKGRSHSNQTKLKMSFKAKEHSKGEKNSQFGTCWITNGKDVKKIKKENLDYYLNIGYIKGRVIKNIYKR